MNTDTKNALRESLQTQRQSLGEEEYRALSEEICLHVATLEVFERARSIHAFWPITRRREVDLRSLIRQAHALGKEVWLPVVEGKELLHGRYSSDDALTQGAFGVMEPVTRQPQSDVSPDVILVPALATDLTGNRLGYGGGFYDRFLKRLQETGQHPLLLATVFQLQVVEHVPVERHDIPIDGTVTEAGIRWHNERQDWV